MIKMLGCALLIVLLKLPLGAFDDTPRCALYLQAHFFEPRYVEEAFDLYRVFQSMWVTIMTDLSYTAPELPARIKAKAKKLKPNPLEYPFDALAAKQLTVEVAYDLFREVMARNYVYDETTVQAMFAYIKSRQQEKLDRCYVPKLKKKPH